MSRANGKARKSNDNYPTPYPLALAITKALIVRLRVLRAPTEVIEPRVIVPAAGKGNFVRAVRACLPKAAITAIDVVDYAAQCTAAGANRFIQGNFVEIATKAAQGDDRGTVDLILDNPPFTLAEDFVRCAVPLLAPGGILALLLRLNFLGSAGRMIDAIAPSAVPFWREFPEADFWPIGPRPSFGLNKMGKKGTDGTEYAPFLWQKNAEGRLINNHHDEIVGDWSDPEADAELQVAYAAANATPPPGLDEAISAVVHSVAAQATMATAHTIAANANNTPGAALDVEV